MDHRFGLGQRAIPGGENINFCGNQEVGSGKYLKGTQKNRGESFRQRWCGAIVGYSSHNAGTQNEKIPAKGGANEQ